MKTRNESGKHADINSAKKNRVALPCSSAEPVASCEHAQQESEYDEQACNEEEEFLRFYEDLCDPKFGCADLDFLLKLIDDGPPHLPNFGIYYLTMAQAAALIAGDLEASSRYPFDQISEAEISDADREKWSKETREKLVKQFEARLKEAVKSSAISSVCRRPNLRSFVDGDAQSIDATRVFIPFMELLNWLVREGYTSRLDMEASLPGLCNFGLVQYRFACEIDGYLNMRAKLCRQNESNKLREYNRQLLIAKTDSFSADDHLASALSEIQFLENQVRVASAYSAKAEERPLETKERESLHKVILALWKISKVSFESRDLTGAIARNLELLGLELSKGTIRTRLKEAKRLLNRR